MGSLLLTLLVTVSATAQTPSPQRKLPYTDEQGVDGDLHVWDGVDHCFHYDPALPESREACGIVARFFDERLGKARIAEAPSAHASQAKPKLILLTPFVDYSFFKTIRKGMTDAARAMDVEATFAGTSDGNVRELAEQLRRAVKDGYDGIAVNMTDSIAFDAAAAEAIARGVPVISFNVDDGRTPNARLATVGQSMPAAGRAFGKAVDRFIPQGSHVLLTMHDPGISALEERAAGARAALQSKGIRWTSLITGTEPAAARDKIRKALEQDSRIKFVLSTGSADTEATGQVMEQHYRDKGYFSAGFDLSPEILRLTKAGVIRLTVDQQPYAQGYYSVVQLALLKRYGIAPSNIDTGAVIIDAGNVDELVELSKQHYR